MSYYQAPLLAASLPNPQARDRRRPGPTLRRLAGLYCARAEQATGAAFFFSSRRRYTRCSRDWSSDVCSSDLCLLYSSGDNSIEVVWNHATAEDLAKDIHIAILKDYVCDIHAAGNDLVKATKAARSQVHQRHIGGISFLKALLELRHLFFD